MSVRCDNCGRKVNTWVKGIGYEMMVTPCDCMKGGSERLSERNKNLVDRAKDYLDSIESELEEARNLLNRVD